MELGIDVTKMGMVEGGEGRGGDGVGWTAETNPRFSQKVGSCRGHKAAEAPCRALAGRTTTWQHGRGRAVNGAETSRK